MGLRYGNGPEIFTDVSFSLAAGSLHYLTGSSGAGKSSLLSLLFLGRHPSRGSVWLFGRDLAQVPRKELPAIRRRIGVVFQDFRLLDHLTAYDNVALPLRVAGVSEARINKDVRELLSWVGLKNHMDARPPTLSGGQKQRVAIARAVISRPDLVVADEPTGSVDDSIATRLMYLLFELNKLGTTVMVATHNEALVRRFPFPCLNLDRGRLTFVPGSGASADAPLGVHNSQSTRPQTATPQYRTTTGAGRGDPVR
ncbi:MAG: cell division ATP-binding protein FtsE [Rhodospirillaceae bacterium]